MIDDALLDRLVDGELSAEERRTLLATLERSPDGWRRCALAFVELQVVGECLGGLVTPPGSGTSRLTNVQPSVAQRAGSSPIAAEQQSTAASWWSIAAAVLVAFGVGVITRGLPTEGNPSPVATTENTALDNQPLEESLVVWAADGAADRREIRAPLLDADAVHQRFGVRFRSSPPPELLQEFEQRGYRLSTQRRFAPLYVGGGPNGAGRPIVVPVEDVRVVPIRNVSL